MCGAHSTQALPPQTASKPPPPQPASANYSKSSKSTKHGSSSTSSEPLSHSAASATAHIPSEYGTHSLQLQSPNPPAEIGIAPSHKVFAVQHSTCDKPQVTAAAPISTYQPSAGSAQSAQPPQPPQNNQCAATQALQGMTLSGCIYTSRGTITPHGGHPAYYYPGLPGTYMHEPPSMSDSVTSAAVTTR